jgi:hypothetical protein
MVGIIIKISDIPAVKLIICVIYGHTSLSLITRDWSTTPLSFPAIQNSKNLPKKPEKNRKKRKPARFSGQVFTLFLVLKPAQFSKNCLTSAVKRHTPH